ncbi:hypothetical protein [Paenibacillus ginsengihumi]|uniref:hypothetical protein n=1 Tax=Paenibacillus ginsengihumi TaxID=431596 RepID=UPI000378B366|nr:hypothetical protein [Paenibacillus ginsengihumi]
MDWIAVQPYYKVEREITGIEQQSVVSERAMYLYPDKIVTWRREFSLNDVFDMSFRRMGAEGGILYLHTKRGVYSYTVKIGPDPFMKAYRALQTDQRNKL